MAPPRRELSRRSWLQAVGLGLVAAPSATACRKKAAPAPESSAPTAPTARNASTVRTDAYEVQRFEVDVQLGRARFTENVYLLSNRKTADAILIDPGAVDPRIERSVQRRKLRVRRILNTHGHPDHIGANGHYAKRYAAPVWAHAGDRALYEQSPENRPSRLFRAQAQLTIGSLQLTVLHTPGHTPGSVCFHLGGLLFTGDTLFRGSIGRTWGSPAERRRLQRQQILHIKTRLLVLPPTTRVLPGHGSPSTIGHEQRSNPHLT